jgi:cold shock CspA family protein
MSQRFGREQVMNALKAGGGRSLHVMELLQILGAPKNARDDVREVLQQLRELGLAKELPGNRFRIGPGRRNAAPAPPAVSSSAARGESGLRIAAASNVERTAPGGSVARDRDRAGRDAYPRPAGDVIPGWLSITPRGFAFVTADDGGPDVFVTARSIGTAMHGDRVEVAVRRSAQGREGEVVRVLERGLLRIAGVLTRDRRQLMI